MSSGDPETRRKILEAARILIEKHPGGYVRLSDIGKQAGVSRQAVYLHFSSRSRLLEQLADYVDEAEGVDAQIDEVLEAPSPAEVLDGIAKLHSRHRPKVAAVASALDRAIFEDPELAGVWRAKLAGRRTLATGAIHRIKDAGALSQRWTDDDAIDLLTALTSFRTWKELTEDCGWPPDRYQQTISHALRETLLVPEARDLPVELSARDAG